jgi:hypothetical protein
MRADKLTSAVSSPVSITNSSNSVISAEIMSPNALMVSSEVSTAPRAVAVSVPSRPLVPSLPDADAKRKRWI